MPGVHQDASFPWSDPHCCSGKAWLWGGMAHIMAESGAVPHFWVYYAAGTFARFQPATADFQKEVGADMEAVLEAALHARSSLSQGDWVEAHHAGRSYALCVQHLEPEAAVSVIGESHMRQSILSVWQLWTSP